MKTAFCISLDILFSGARVVIMTELCSPSSTQCVEHGKHSDHPRVGTRRYMAPEMLSADASVYCFDALKMADIYSFSLVLWELATR